MLVILSSLTLETWVAFLTPVAVVASIVLQKTNAVQVKLALEEAGVKSDDKLNVIHGLVNGNMTEQKRVTMLQASRIAAITKDPADIALAEDAARSYRDFQSRTSNPTLDQIMQQHRVMVTDGLSIRVIFQRLAEVENRLHDLESLRVPGEKVKL
jgi:hypothetical protein